MTRIHIHLQAGFSAVELLITLFIAAAFIATGAQLYSVVIKNSDDARQRARASNIAYDTLQKNIPKATNPCTTSNPTATVPANSGLTGSITMTVSITCPYGNGDATSKVQVLILYNSPQQEVVHAQFVTN